jgi:hypothetical protein
VKEAMVIQRAFENIRLESEHVAEFRCQPVKCARAYRGVILRKNLSVAKGEQTLFDEIKHVFYITTREDFSASERGGSGQRAVRPREPDRTVEERRPGQALRMPVDNLLSNWAYMVMASLAGNRKAWWRLMVRFRDRQEE